MRKKALVLVVLSLLLLLLCACGSKENAIVGKWTYVADESTTDGIWFGHSHVTIDNVILSIYSDGTWTLNEPGYDVWKSGTYNIVNDGTAISFTITASNEIASSISFSISENKLVLSQGRKKLTLVKS